MPALVSCQVHDTTKLLCCCAVQQQQQWLLRCWKSQQWICRPLSGSPCASIPRVSVFHRKETKKKEKEDCAFRRQFDEKPSITFSTLYGLSISNEPCVTCHPPGNLCPGGIHSCFLCCAYIFASSTRTGGPEHKLLCCRTKPRQCLAQWHVLHIGAQRVCPHRSTVVCIQHHNDASYATHAQS